MTVVENITMPVLMDGRKVNDQRLGELIGTLGQRAGSATCPTSFPAASSSGFHRAGADEFPAVVLADEPTGNLDSKNSQEIVELLKLSNKRYGQTLIIITHDENIALQANRIIALDDGKIVRDEVIRP